MNQKQLNEMAKKASSDYASKIITAPFKQQRVLGVTIEGAWQIEQRFVNNVKRCAQIATAFNLVDPFAGIEIEEPTEPGMFDEEG